MQRINFCPKTDGFAFSNHWTLEPMEQAIMPGLMIDIFDRADSELQFLFEAAARGTGVAVAVGGHFAGLALGSAVSTGLGSVAAGAYGGASVGGFIGAAFGAIFAFFGIWAAASPKSLAKKILEELLKANPAVGFCGGMAYAALDYFQAGLILPRGDGADNQPKSIGSTDPEEVWLRHYIFSRLRDSLLQDGHRFLEIQSLYNFGDIAEDVGEIMRFITATACAQIMADIDKGQPCGLGLVSTSLDPSHSHQIVCYGYERHGDDVVDFLVYDNNLPDKECVLQIRFGQDSVAIVHYDEYLSWNGAAFVATGAMPSYCAIIYLEYRHQIPHSAVVAPRQMKANPKIVVSGDNVSLSFDVINTGFGKTPPAVVSLSGEASDGTASTAQWVSEMDHGSAAHISYMDTPTFKGSKIYKVEYKQITNDPSRSVVSCLQELGFEAFLPSLAYPMLVSPFLDMINAQVRFGGLSPRNPGPVERVKMLTTTSGARLWAQVTVNKLNIEIGSDDVGNRCDPQAYPDKKIVVRVLEEDSILPATPATSYRWRIHDGSAFNPISTFNTEIPRIEITLPSRVGTLLLVNVSAVYDGLPAPLSGTTTIRVNDEKANKAAVKYCLALRHVGELNQQAREIPKGRERRWAITEDYAHWHTVDELARLIQTQAIEQNIDMKRNIFGERGL